MPKTRPESIDDIDDSDKSRTWASFYTGEFLDIPEVTMAYASFLRAAQKHGATIKDGTVRAPLNSEALAGLLKSRQTSWDNTRKRYDDVRLALENHDIVSLSPAWRDTEAWTLRYHAEQCELPVFDLISANEKDRAVARKIAGLA